MPDTAPDQFLRVEEAAGQILGRTPLRPRIGVVLGSGLGSFADELANAARIPFEEIPNFPRSTAIGHAGQMVMGTLGGVPLAVMQGRVHLYEGYSAQQVAFPVRVLARMGVKAMVLTNAAGGINPVYGKGALVVLRDHINLQGQNPLVGPNDDRLGLRHPDMTDAYNAEFRRFALEESQRLGGNVFEGRIRGGDWAELRNAGGDPVSAGHWRRSGRDVHGAGGDRRPARGDGGAGDFLRDQHGGRHDRRKDHR